MFETREILVGTRGETKLSEYLVMSTSDHVENKRKKSSVENKRKNYNKHVLNCSNPQTNERPCNHNGEIRLEK